MMGKLKSSNVYVSNSTTILSLLIISYELIYCIFYGIHLKYTEICPDISIYIQMMQDQNNPVTILKMETL